MARKDALLRVHQRLVGRRDELLRMYSGALGNLKRHDETGDDADVATEAISNEMNSQLAQLECRELAQVQRALARLKQGTYGTCELCSAKIPVPRLNALPYATVCIGCQRELELNPERAEALEKVAETWGDDFDDEAQPLADGEEAVETSDSEMQLESS